MLVESAGSDGLFSTDDDIAANRVDVHVRKLAKKAIQSGAHSAGKGLVQGAMEGIREETAENVQETKRKASELLARFKRNQNGG